MSPVYGCRTTFAIPNASSLASGMLASHGYPASKDSKLYQVRETSPQYYRTTNSMLLRKCTNRAASKAVQTVEHQGK